jgi:hypothetical protein
MRYFAYENWRAHGHVVKVHLPACPFCNDGTGLAGGTRRDNGRWLELDECSSVAQAVAVARQRTGAPEVRACRTCSP